MEPVNIIPRRPRINFSPTDCFFIKWEDADGLETEAEVMFLQTWDGLDEAGYVFYPVSYIEGDDFPRVAGDPFIVPYDSLRHVDIQTEEEAVRLFADPNSEGDVREIDPGRP